MQPAPTSKKIGSGSGAALKVAAPAPQHCLRVHAFFWGQLKCRIPKGIPWKGVLSASFLNRHSVILISHAMPGYKALPGASPDDRSPHTKGSGDSLIRIIHAMPGDIPLPGASPDDRSPNTKGSGDSVIRISHAMPGNIPLPGASPDDRSPHTRGSGDPSPPPPGQAFSPKTTNHNHFKWWFLFTATPTDSTVLANLLFNYFKIARF